MSDKCTRCGTPYHEKLNPDCGGHCHICITDAELMGFIDNKYVAETVESHFEAMREVIKERDALVKLQKPWISVTDELPEWDLETNTSDHILCLWEDGTISITVSRLVEMDTPKFQAPCGTDEGCEGCGGNVGYVTHWMPLPELPGGDL